MLATPVQAQTDVPQPMVHVLLFWNDNCPHCHEVIDHVLPPLKQRYGAQLEIQMIQVKTMEDYDRLINIVTAYDVAAGAVGVPLLIIGDQVLIGPDVIEKRLPNLIVDYIMRGGAALPAGIDLDSFAQQENQISVYVDPEVVVGGIYFTTSDCYECDLYGWQTITAMNEAYFGQLDIQVVEISTSTDVDYLYEMAAQFGLNKDNVDLPMFMIGDHILMGEEIPEQLPALIEGYLLEGGVEMPVIPDKPETTRAKATPTPLPAAESQPKSEIKTGFGLAALVMVFMAVVLVLSVMAFFVDRPFDLPDWADQLIPILIVTGMFVAAYLSYVEVLSMSAVCGPVGDCNTVQQSQYATLFDILPVGVFGLFGLAALLAAWLARRFLPGWEKQAALAFWSMSFFGVLFSLYLTYLELNVIKAVCMWCLTSAVNMTILLFLGTPPAVRYFIEYD